jgi:hypothetical protein
MQESKQNGTDIFDGGQPGMQKVRLTTLYRIEPAWTADGQPESLSSYFVRLSAAHCVSPRSLLKHVVVPCASQLSGALLPGFNAGFGAPVNGLGPYAISFADTLNRLTGRDDLQQLTMLPLGSLLTINGPSLIAGRRRWCPYCLYDAAYHARPIVSPLAWHLALYTVCPTHLVGLQSACLSCLREQPIIPPIATYALCAYCQRPLYQNPNLKHPEVEAGKESVDAVQDSRAITHVSILSGLLKWATAKSPTNLRERFCKVITRLADQFAEGSATAFFRRVGLPATIGKRWLAHQEKPSLPQFVRVCEALGAQPEELLGEERLALASRVRARLSAGEPALLIDAAVVRKVSRRFRESERLEIAARLKPWLANPLAPEVNDVARELGMSKFAFRYWFPNEYAALSAAASARRAKALAAKEGALRAEIKRTCRTLTTNGVYPSKHRVKNALKRAGKISRWNPRLELFLKEAQTAPIANRNGDGVIIAKNVLSAQSQNRQSRTNRN